MRKVAATSLVLCDQGMILPTSDKGNEDLLHLTWKISRASGKCSLVDYPSNIRQKYSIKKIGKKEINQGQKWKLVDQHIKMPNCICHKTSRQGGSDTPYFRVLRVLRISSGKIDRGGGVDPPYLICRRLVSCFMQM